MNLSALAELNVTVDAYSHFVINLRLNIYQELYKEQPNYQHQSIKSELLIFALISVESSLLTLMLFGLLGKLLRLSFGFL